MAFTKKTWKNRACTYPGRRRLTPTGTANVYDVTREEGLVVDEGDAFSQTTMNDLENRIATAFSAVSESKGTISSGNCNSLTASGFYTVTNAVSNIPANETGILEVYHSGSQIVQKWSSAGGNYTRWSGNGSTWGSWYRGSSSADPILTVSETEPATKKVNDLWAW